MTVYSSLFLFALLIHVPLFILVHKASKSLVELEDEMFEFQLLQESSKFCDVEAIKFDLNSLNFFIYYQVIVVLNLPVSYYLILLEKKRVRVI